jgi:hypothetical protein
LRYRTLKENAMRHFNQLVRFVLLTAVILTGCTTPVTNLEMIHSGMTKEEVVRTLGNRMEGNFAMGIEILIFDLATDQVRAAMYSGKLINNIR